MPISKTKPKKTNIIEETAAKGIKDISDTIESSKKVNDLLIRKSILMAEVAIKQNEINTIDRKIADTLRKNPLNEFLLKIASEVEQFEPKELSQFLDAIKPLSNLFDISKFLANQTTKEISNTVKSNVRIKSKRKK